MQKLTFLHVFSIKFQVAPKVLRSLSAVHTAHRPGIVGRILCMVAQVGEPGAIAVASRQVDAVRRCQHLFQVALTVGQGLPQVQIHAALADGQLGQLLIHPAQHIGSKTRLLGGRFRTHRRDRLHIDHAVRPQRLPQHVQHLAVIGQEPVGSTQRGEGVGAE